MDKFSKIYVAGHNGLVGSALVRKLKEQGYENISTVDHKDIDLTDQSDVNCYFTTEEPEYVFLSAAKVGGIQGNNTYSADFGYINTMISANVIHASYKYQVKKLLYLGSCCIYPKECPVPVKEEYFLTGKLEPTNIAYAMAKINGIILCDSYNKQYGTKFISCMPTNLLGIGDNYHPTDSHVIPGLIRRFHEAKVNKLSEVVVWGTGKAYREFLYSDDLAEACLFLMNNYEGPGIVNVGSGEEVSIKKLVKMIKEVVGYEGNIFFDTSKPDGTIRRVLDSTKINNLGWKAKTPLKDTLRIVYTDFCNRYNKP